MAKLIISHYMPQDHGVHVDFLIPWTDRIGKACPSLTFDVHCEGSEYGLLNNQFSQVLLGVVNIAHSPASLPPGRFPLTNLISLPFLVKDSQQASTRLWAAYKPYLEKEFFPFCLLALHADSGAVLHMRDQAITSIEDFADKRIRMPLGVISQTMAEIGAIPVHLSPPDIAQAAQEGKIDGAIMAWDVLAYTQTQNIFRCHYEDIFYVSPLYLIMNPHSRACLTNEECQVLDQHSGATLTKYFGSWWRKWSSAGRLLAEQQDHMIKRLPAGVLSALREVASGNIRHYVDHDFKENNNQAHEVIRIFSGQGEEGLNG